MFDPILNFSYATIVTPPSPAGSGSTFTIINSEDIFPDPSTDGEFNITVWASGQLPKNSNATIVRVTDKSVGATHTTFTFTRTQESSNNRDIVAGDQIILSITKKTIDDIRNEIIIGRNLSVGCSVEPSYTNNGSGNITVDETTVRLFSTSDFTGAINEYVLEPITVTLTDNTTNYIVADYNSGTPILKVITDVSLINESNIVQVYTIIRTGTVLHTLDWDRMGLGLSNKIHQRLIKTERFVRESGLALSETGTRNLVLSSGVAWYGAKAQTLDAINTSTDNLIFYYHVAGVWTASPTEVSYNNTQYDNGTNLATLTANRYAVIWVFRGVEDQKHLYAVLGTGDYTLIQAQSAVVPALPPTITSHAILVGKVIVQKSASTATSIESAFDINFSFSSASAHNDLIGIQGGGTNEYYHLTSAQYNSVVSGQNSFIIREAVNETPNGTITAFTIDSTPVSGSECVHLDGVLQNVGAGNDYTISGSTITFNIAPPTGSVILVSYQYSTSTSGNADTLDGYHANTTPTANNIPVLDSNAKIPFTATYSREVLTANRTYYVRKDGSDSNNGLADTAGGAFLTIQKAVDEAAKLDISIYDVNIYVRTGTYVETVTLKNAVGAGNINLIGNTTTPSSVVIDSGVIKSSEGTPYYINGFKFNKSSGSANSHIFASGNSKITFGQIDFGVTGQFHINCAKGQVFCNGNYTISSGGQNHIYGNTQGFISIISYTITITGTPAFTNGFLSLTNLSMAVVANNTFSGSATGPRYQLFTNSVAQTNSATLPGNSAGSVATGGYYY